MKYCPITYDVISENEVYSKRGLRLLSPQLNSLSPLTLTAKEQRLEAAARVGKMSVQGVQPKLSAQLKVKEGHFEIVDQFGHYILKTQSDIYPEVPENEALSMTMAKLIGLEVPAHGLVYAKDNSMTYFIKRFDRTKHRDKLAVEDFAQLSLATRDTKYDSSMEKVAKIIEKYCTFPKIETVKLYKLTLFNFLIGNEDMHLKNFSVITRGKIITLSPAYDLLNSTIILSRSKEELALPLNGKKNNLTKKSLLHYFPIEYMQLNQSIVDSILQQIESALPHWLSLIERSFLSKNGQEKYLELLNKRWDRLK